MSNVFKVKVVVETKSNFKGCNGVELDVVEMSGDRVTVDVPRYGFNLKGEPCGTFGHQADFTLSEVKSIRTIIKQ